MRAGCSTITSPSTSSLRTSSNGWARNSCAVIRWATVIAFIVRVSCAAGHYSPEAADAHDSPPPPAYAVKLKAGAPPPDDAPD